MTVSVIVPRRSDNNGPRDAAWLWVQQWWADNYPHWQLVEGHCDSDEWRKAAAVADGLTRAGGDVLVIADADVVCDGVSSAVVALQRGAPWAVPHRGVYRLSETATAAVLAGAPMPVLDRRLPRSVVAESYTGVAGGGMVVLPAETYRRVPLDPRFVGWNREDVSWGHALLVAVGSPYRGSAPLWHLWHPPAEGRRKPDREGEELHARYRAACTPSRIAAVLADIV